MPTLDKMFTLTVSVEQFLEACSDVELQELELLLPKYIQKIRNKAIQEELNAPVDLKCDTTDAFMNHCPEKVLVKVSNDKYFFNLCQKCFESNIKRFKIPGIIVESIRTGNRICPNCYEDELGFDNGKLRCLCCKEFID